MKSSEQYSGEEKQGGGRALPLREFQPGRRNERGKKNGKYPEWTQETEAPSSAPAGCACGDDCGCGEEDGRSWEIFAGGGLLLAAMLADRFLPGIGIFSLPIYAAAYLLLGRNVLAGAFRGIARGKWMNENFLMSIATLAAFAIREYPEAVGIMLFYRIGELLEDNASEKSHRALMAAAALQPETILRVTGVGTETIPAREARAGDVYLVRPGDRVALDSVVLEGESFLDTSSVTGESVPRRVCPGREALSGSVNGSGLLKLRAEKPLESSVMTRLIAAVEQAAESKPHMNRFITRFAAVYTPAVVLLALFTAVGMPLLRGEAFVPWIYTAVSFLVVSCPCALVVSVPLAFYCGVGRGAAEGILFKGGVTLEKLARIKAVAMDKTGTLTSGSFTVTSIEPAAEKGLSEEELLCLAAACEKNSTHPIAVSIMNETKSRKILLPEASEVREISGSGIEACVGGGKMLCGSRRFLADRAVQGLPPEAEQAGASVLLSRDGEYLGRIIIADTLKADAAAAVSELKNRGFSPVILTGDSAENAMAAARQAGIENVLAELLPERKLQVLRELREEKGPVLYVGDGLNDAAVLAGADVGAAMGSGAAAALEAADIVFLNSGMQALPRALRLAERVRRIAVQNVVLAIAFKLAVLLVGVLGIYSDLWLAVAADTGTAAICILNSVRLLRRKK